MDILTQKQSLRGILTLKITEKLTEYNVEAKSHTCQCLGGTTCTFQSLGSNLILMTKFRGIYDIFPLSTEAALMCGKISPPKWIYIYIYIYFFFFPFVMLDLRREAGGNRLKIICWKENT